MMSFFAKIWEREGLTVLLPEVEGFSSSSTSLATTSSPSVESVNAAHSDFGPKDRDVAGRGTSYSVPALYGDLDTMPSNRFGI